MPPPSSTRLWSSSWPSPWSSSWCSTWRSARRPPAAPAAPAGVLRRFPEHAANAAITEHDNQRRSLAAHRHSPWARRGHSPRRFCPNAARSFACFSPPATFFARKRPALARASPPFQRPLASQRARAYSSWPYPRAPGRAAASRRSPTPASHQPRGRATASSPSPAAAAAGRPDTPPPPPPLSPAPATGPRAPRLCAPRRADPRRAPRAGRPARAASSTTASA